MTGISLATGTKQHAHSERGDDLYETPEVAVRALLEVEKLPPVVWEPACGRGAISSVLRDGAGIWVISSDLVNYGYPGAEARDFFLYTKLPDNAQAIVTNPPFKRASEFVAHALALSPRVIMLLRLAFLESERRTPILDTGHLARVHVFRKRLPMMHRDGWQGPKSSSAMAFAWFVWDRSHSGPTELRRI